MQEPRRFESNARRCRTHASPRSTLLDDGELDFALGFLPSIHDTERSPLIDDRYVVILRAGHPFTKSASERRLPLTALKTLDFVAVRSQSETLRILELLNLKDRVRLSATHLLALPAIVRATNLGVVLPGHIARGFAGEGGHSVLELRLPLRDFVVSMDWSKRRRLDPTQAWLKQLIEELFGKG